jgi:aryl-alcohol dehydrogenase-like predicted oxidoreductase
MTSLDSYITLGRSGLRVSPLSLGTMTFGEDNGWGASPETSEAILAEYLDRGGNVVDTANTYTNGHSEKIVGGFFSARRGLRERAVLSTKFFANLHPGDPNGGGAGRKALIAQLEESLRRLQTDYVDLYWLHGWDRRAPIEETLRALDDMVAAGKVRYIGLSNVPAWSPRRPRRSPTSAAGRRSLRCSSSTRSWGAHPRASCCRWPKRSAWACCRGVRCAAAT